MKPTIYLFSLVLFPSLLHAVHFRTLVNGNWNNTTNVWSTNGVTPCGCAPSVNLLSDTISVNHPINLTGNLIASTLSKLEINQNGQLTNALFDVSISNSILLANGSINIKKLTVQSGGTFAITNSVLMLNGTSVINGQFTANSSSVYLLSGNLDVTSVGQIYLNNGARVNVTNGNIRNSGQISICISCCISFDRGGINNELSGQLVGDGSAITYNGNFKNLNLWSTGIDYCSTGNDQGMPIPENCIAANSICLNSPLASFIQEFTASSNWNSIILSWKSLTQEMDHFLISRSVDGMDWVELARISPSTLNPQQTDYSWEDTEPLDGINYYQLSVIDKNVDTIEKNITSIFQEGNDEIRLFPNPTEHSLYLKCASDCSVRNVHLYSTLGQLIATYSWPENETGLTIYLPAIYGIYYLTVYTDDGVKHFKIRKTGE